MLKLAKIGFANLINFMTITPDGQPVIDFSRLTRDQAGALQEVSVAESVDGRGDDARVVRRAKFKLAGKREALMDIAKIMGWVVERRQATVYDALEQLSDEELLAIAEGRMEPPDITGRPPRGFRPRVVSP